MPGGWIYQITRNKTGFITTQFVPEAKKALTPAEIKQILENNRNETLWGDSDSNEVMQQSIQNFIVAVEDDIKEATHHGDNTSEKI